jgi:hypothetical protein
MQAAPGVQIAVCGGKVEQIGSCLTHMLRSLFRTAVAPVTQRGEAPKVNAALKTTDQ